MTICDRSGMFSGKLFLNVPAELRESWDRKDFSFPLVPRLLTLPELSEPFRRSVEGTLPLSEDSTSSVKRILESMVATRCEKHKPTTAPDLAERNRKLIWPLENQSEKSVRLYYSKKAIKKNQRRKRVSSTPITPKWKIDKFTVHEEVRDFNQGLFKA